MSTQVKKISCGTIVFGAIISTIVGLIIGYFWMNSLDLNTCMSSVNQPNSSNIIANIFALMIEGLAVAVTCILMRLVVYIPIYLCLSIIICIVIILYKVKNYKVLNIIVAILLSQILACIGMIVLSIILKK
jgi:hypothetical protein